MARKSRVRLTTSQRKTLRKSLTAKQKKQIRSTARTIVKKQANKCHAKTKSMKSFKKCMRK